MSDGTDVSVDATRSESTVGVVGTDHVTLEGTNTADTIEFYRDILGMPLVLRQPNLDRRHLTHLFFDAGDGRLVTFFVDEQRDSVDLSDPEPGQVHHMAFRIDGDRVDDIRSVLEEAGYPVSEFDRGAFRSLYTEDHNGLVIELVADKFAVPDDRRAEVLALAHHLRQEDGADFVESEHMRAAIDQLDLEVDERAVSDTETAAGRDVD